MPSAITRTRPFMPCKASAAIVPNTAARVAEVKATVKLVRSASVTKGLDSVLPYHCTENPIIWVALLPELKLKNAITAIGTYRNR